MTEIQGWVLIVILAIISIQIEDKSVLRAIRDYIVGIKWRIYEIIKGKKAYLKKVIMDDKITMLVERAYSDDNYHTKSWRVYTVDGDFFGWVDCERLKSINKKKA